MGFFKVEKDGYILGVAKTYGKGNITESEYNTLTEILRNRPAAPEGFRYCLTTGLQWELVEISGAEEMEETLSETEQKARAFDILMGVAE